MTQLLAGVRVVEVAVLLNGSTASMHLADLGADVIKVESPAPGDYLRFGHTGHLHAQVNKGKRSVVLDLKSEAGREALGRLVSTADVFVTNVLGPSLASLGITYEQLRAHREDLVYCQVTGFGGTGPYAPVPAHGQMMDAVAGTIPTETGPDGLARMARPPAVRSGSLSVAGEATSMSAVFAAFHICAALAHRARTGRGCVIDVSAADAAFASAWTSVVSRLNLPEERQWWLRPDAGEHGARYQVYLAADGRYLMFCPEERKFWERFCLLADRPDLLERTSGYELRAEIQRIIGARGSAEWMKLAIEHRLPLAPVNDGVAEVAADPQVRSRGVLQTFPGPDGRDYTGVRQPALIDGQACEPPSPAPALGEHTREVLAELGYDEARQSVFAMRAEPADGYIIADAQGADEGSGS
ncbi:formyl-CoA transferase [Amycolatopsis bartoniae]|uniref:CoA transferase n=1 Tax=Amycolatopsis bartoniae TaxID=941986 RepID=A0A8H9ITK7_9PSEU|nr:CoA transferase [Amycolatopsis bartoniae]MBB2939682.1 formyl-CoA transferase [Amycolatopsis bartoniae]TVT06197.1 CoA transferase [Amycolatopsis bartoniae]GHF36537.1 CoA transferase [Amycolatopsis bartoniae]